MNKHFWLTDTDRTKLIVRNVHSKIFPCHLSGEMLQLLPQNGSTDSWIDFFYFCWFIWLILLMKANLQFTKSHNAVYSISHLENSPLWQSVTFNPRAVKLFCMGCRVKINFVICSRSKKFVIYYIKSSPCYISWNKKRLLNYGICPISKGNWVILKIIDFKWPKKNAWTRLGLKGT